MQNHEVKIFRILFVVAAIWNLIGTVFGYFNTAYTFAGFFDRALTDPLFYAIYKGSWGTTFVYFFGYLIVAYRPLKHSGIVIVGGIGKVGFLITLVKLYLAGLANAYVFIVIVGDTIFALLFIYYFWRLYRSQTGII